METGTIAELADRFVAGFDYPMLVVTTANRDGVRAGCLVGFTSQVSIDPFRFLVCLSHRNRTYRVAQNATHLAVHVLDGTDPGQRDLAVLFGSETGDETDKFARCASIPGPAGVPLLENAARHLVGRITNRLNLGDHSGFLLAPTQIGLSPGTANPLLFASLPDFPPGHSA